MTPLTPEETLQLARFALDHTDEAAFWADTDGRFLYVNKAACRTLGSTAAELLGKNLFQMSPELTPELWAQLWKEIKSHDSFVFEFSLKPQSGDVFPVEMTVYHLPIAHKEVLCAFYQNIHEKKHLQELKNEFVSTVSHELRTPMTIIRESVSQLLDGLWGEVPASQREALYVTLTGIDRLARIINDLLDISKMEAGKATLRWDRFDLLELIHEVVETFASRARERGLELRSSLPGGPVIVYADYDRLIQVLTNLIGNALKFSEKGTIEVTVRETTKDIECSVSDTGIGIAPADFDKVFNKFEQLSQPAVTGEKGSGLGLSICKGIIELHQGRIDVQSQLGRGTTFTLVLPQRTAEDLFKQKMSGEWARATATKGYLSAVIFELRNLKPMEARKARHSMDWAVDELVETLKVTGTRKTDILFKDAKAVWLGLPGMNKKETQRIIRQALEAYTQTLEKNGVAAEIQLSTRSCSFPEDVSTERDFLQPLVGGEKKNAA